MIEDFAGALDFVLSAEGRYVDDPSDPGGATNLGIEQVEYDAWRRSLRQPPRPVSLITTAEASAIYKSRYWDVIHGDYLATALAWALFDTAVNTGCGTAIKFLQQSLDVPVTFSFDRATSNAYHNEISREDSTLSLADEVLDERIEYYHSISTRSPSLLKFLGGWLARVQHLKITIASLAKNELDLDNH